MKICEYLRSTSVCFFGRRFKSTVCTRGEPIDQNGLGSNWQRSSGASVLERRYRGLADRPGRMDGHRKSLDDRTSGDDLAADVYRRRGQFCTLHCYQLRDSFRRCRRPGVTAVSSALASVRDLGKHRRRRSDRESFELWASEGKFEWPATKSIAGQILSLRAKPLRPVHHPYMLRFYHPLASLPWRPISIPSDPPTHIGEGHPTRSWVPSFLSIVLPRRKASRGLF